MYPDLPAEYLALRAAKLQKIAELAELRRVPPKLSSRYFESRARNPKLDDLIRALDLRLETPDPAFR